MSRRILLYLLLPAFAAGLYFLTRQPSQEPSALAETPSTGVHAQAPASSDALNSEAPPASPEKPASPTLFTNPVDPWTDIMNRARSLNPDSDEELDTLYDKARAFIEGDQRKALDQFKDLAPRLGDLTMPESFFAVSSLMRFSDSPDQVLNAVLENRPRDEGSGPRGHQEAPTPGENYDRVQAYAVRELRDRIEGDPQVLNEQMRANLVTQMADRARGERSLDVSWEMIQTLKTLNAPHAVETALSGHSPRDQELLRGMLE